MRLSRLICLVVAAGVLSGCGVMEWLDSDPDDLKLAAMVREEVERVEAERGATRRSYIDQRIEKKIGTVAQDSAELDKLEQKIAALATRMDTLARRTSPNEIAAAMDRQSGPSEAEVESLRADTSAVVSALADLSEDARRRDAAVNARFERLEYRTRSVPWPRTAPDQPHGVHLASYRSHDSALRGWHKLLDKYPLALKGQDPVLIEIETVSGRFVRLIAGAGLPDGALARMRNQVRAGGDYAMILPLQPNLPARTSSAPKKPAPGS